MNYSARAVKVELIQLLETVMSANLKIEKLRFKSNRGGFLRDPYLTFIWEMGDIYSRLLRSFTARGFSSRDPTRV